MKKSEMTRKRILDAARTVYYEEGYQSLSIRRISEVSNVAIGNIYYYYDHKETLIQEMMMLEWQGTFEKLRGHLAEVENSDESFKVFFQTLSEDIISRKGLVLHLMKSNSDVFNLRAIMKNPLNDSIVEKIDHLLNGFERESGKNFENRKFLSDLVLLEVMNCAMQPDLRDYIMTNTIAIIKKSLV